MNVKKFAQDKAKKMKYEKYLKENKENLYSVDDSKFKQFSVDLHKLSMDHDYPIRNLAKEEISIFLDNHSQIRTFHNDKNLLEAELKKLIKKLDESDGKMKDFLESELEQGEQIRAEDIRKLMGVLSKKLNSESTRSSLVTSKSQPSPKHPGASRYQSAKILSEQSITPYLKQQIQTMQQRLRLLEEENSQYKEFKNIEKSQKEYIRHTLENVYKRQMEEVYQLEQLRNIL